MFDPDAAELSCERHRSQWLERADERVRRRVLERVLGTLDQALADELGQRVADTFTRLEILDAALDDYAHRVDVAFGEPLN